MVIALQVIKDIEEKYLIEIIERLNSNGIILDEESPSIHSTVMERWNKSCDDFLRQHGYKGGNLVVTGHFYSNHGAVYALFDGNLIDYGLAQQVMNNHVSNYKYD